MQNFYQIRNKFGDMMYKYGNFLSPKQDLNKLKDFLDSININLDITSSKRYNQLTKEYIEFNNLLTIVKKIIELKI